MEFVFELNTRGGIPFPQAIMYYFVCYINTKGLNWQEKSTLSMIKKKGPQSTNKIVKHVGNMAQDEKQFLN